MAPIKVLVAGGSGDLGSNIVKALAADADYQVTVLTRPGSGSSSDDGSGSRRWQELRALPITVATADYADHRALVNALHGIEIVVAALNSAHLLEPQLALINAAKEAGVRRFVPSEFGFDTGLVPSPLKEANRAVQKAIEAAGIEYTYYYNGYFYHYVTGAFFGVDVANGAARVVGSGDVPLSATDVSDIGRYVAATLKTPHSRNATLRIQGEQITFNEVIRLVNQQAGRTLQVSQVPAEQVRKAIAQDGVVAHRSDAFLLLADEGSILLTDNQNHLAPSVAFNSFDSHVKANVSA